MLSKETVAIILAGGSGSRMSWNKPKQFIKVAGKSIIEHTLHIFDLDKNIDRIIVVSNPKYIDITEDIILKMHPKSPVNVVSGGKTRQESSYFGLKVCPEGTKYVLIHDAVRPFVTYKMISDIIENLKKYPAVDVAIPSADTIIKLNDDMNIKEIPKRKYLWCGQTPQGFWYDKILKAHEMARKEGFSDVTDDCGLFMKYFPNDKVKVVRGDLFNIKITYPSDIYLADEIFRIKNIKLSFKEFNEKEIQEEIKGKVAIVFGHTGGIGKEIYHLLQKIGARAYGFSRRTGVDVTDIWSVKSALEKVYQKEGRIDFVINTAGVFYRGVFDSMNWDEINQMIQVNYVGNMIVARESLKYLSETKGMLLLFGSSSYTRGRALSAVYSSTKAAVVNFMQGIADEVSGLGIKVNVISPERTKTPMREKAFGKEDSKTLLDPKDVARATIKVLTLPITGQIISVKKEKLRGYN